MTPEEYNKIERNELDADMKMKGLKVVDYDLYLRYQNKMITWVAMSIAGIFIVGMLLGAGVSLARTIFGG